jgi:hypothetical protein
MVGNVDRNSYRSGRAASIRTQAKNIQDRAGIFMFCPAIQLAQINSLPPNWHDGRVVKIDDYV